MKSVSIHEHEIPVYRLHPQIGWSHRVSGGVWAVSYALRIYLLVRLTK